MAFSTPSPNRHTYQNVVVPCETEPVVESVRDYPYPEVEYVAEDPIVLGISLPITQRQKFTDW